MPKQVHLLPNLFIIGAAKAGTTTLYDVLKQYPRVYFPVQKEPSFFSDDVYFDKGIDWYKNTFYAHSEKFCVRGDATPRYLYWGEKVVPRIQAVCAETKPKFIAIFRDPVELVYSYYWQNVREGRETLSFCDALQAEEKRVAENREFMESRGRFTYAYSKIAKYASQLQPFLKAFPRESFLFLLTEDLNNINLLSVKLEKFLTLEHRVWNEGMKSNVSRLPRSRTLHQWLIRTSPVKNVMKRFLPYSFRHSIKLAAINLNLKKLNVPPLDTNSVTHLRNHYRDEIQNLEKLIKRDLSTWQGTTETDA